MDEVDHQPSSTTSALPARGPGVAVEPAGTPGWLTDAVLAGGGRLVDLSQADALLWASHDDPDGLRSVLDLHGEHLPVDFELLPSTCPRQPLACPVRVRGAISRSAFGMRKWRAMLSDKVELDLRIVLRSSPDAPPPATVPSPSAPAH